MVPPPNTPSQPHNPTFFNTVLNQSTTGAPSSSSPRAPRQPPQQPPTFSATQRDQQARNKPYGTAGSGGGDSYEDRQRRDEARSILENVEMLIWYSAARNESIPQTRAHFQHISLGLPSSEREVVWAEEWDVAVREEQRGLGTRSPRSAKGKGKERENKSGKRVSSGHGQ